MNSQPGRVMMEENILELLDTGISKHYMDDSLSFIWCNPAFYKMLGYEKKDFLCKYPDLRQYYGGEPDVFEGLRDCFREAYGRGETSAVYQVSMTDCNGENVWVELKGTIVKPPEGGPPILYILYSDIRKWVVQQNEQSRDIQKRTEFIQWMMSEYAGNVYVSDMETYELLYLNKHASETLQVYADALIGKKCYEVIQGRTSPCPFCTNQYLKEDEAYEWEFYNPNLKRTFIIKDRMLNWEGRRARIELSYDMYSTEYKLAKKDQEREAILKTVPAGMIRIDIRDCRTVLWYNDIFLKMIGYTRSQFEEELHNRCD
ncbi:MAG: PAS domain-containing protein [Clostridia bacterium]|nr:PAS domain-containing protein [Clostridia bacterium]